MKVVERQDVAAPDRFETPLYTLSEGARYLDIPASTLSSWVRGYLRRPTGGRIAVTAAPVLTALPRPGHSGPVIPFIGLAKGLVLTAVRRSGVSLHRIRPALVRLEEQFVVPREQLEDAVHIATRFDFSTRPDLRRPTAMPQPVRINEQVL